MPRHSRRFSTVSEKVDLDRTYERSEAAEVLVTLVVGEDDYEVGPVGDVTLLGQAGRGQRQQRRQRGQGVEKPAEGLEASHDTLSNAGRRVFLDVSWGHHAAPD